MNFEVTVVKKKITRKKRKEENDIKRLEKLVLGVSNIFDDTESEKVPKKKRKKSEKPVYAAFSDDESERFKPAWEDEDDLSTSIKEAHTLQGRPDIGHPLKPTDSYNILLKQKFDNIVGDAKWADLNRKPIDSDSEAEEERELLQRCGNFITKTNNLKSGIINISTMKELNAETLCEGKVIKSVEFNKKSSVALVAGLSGRASIFEIGGKVNQKLQTITFPRFDIHCAKFTQCGEQFIVGSKNQRHFYSYDMMSGRTIKIPIQHNSGITNMQKFEVSPDGKLIASCGRFGNIHVFTANTKELIGTLKMNDEVRSISFNSDGSRLYSHGDEGKVYLWDMHNRRCVQKFIDEGCLKGTSICISPDDRLLACGSGSGVVNLYETSTLSSGAECPSPIKVILNLTTAVTSLAFNHSSEILAMASYKLDKAIRLLHCPSLNVYKNFPDPKISMGLINCVNFSPNSGYLGIGNNCTKALLYRLNSFGNY